jgi:hypothetical protein
VKHMSLAAAADRTAGFEIPRIYAVVAQLNRSAYWVSAMSRKPLALDERSTAPARPARDNIQD